MKSLGLVVLAVTLSGCASYGKLIVGVDQADRSAFAALQAFQQLEEAEWHAHATWPTADQHQQIGIKLSGAFDLMAQIAQGTLALPATATTLSASLTNELTILGTMVTDIVALTATAPPAVVRSAKRAQAKVKAEQQKGVPQ